MSENTNAKICYAFNEEGASLQLTLRSKNAKTVVRCLQRSPEGEEVDNYLVENGIEPSHDTEGQKEFQKELWS